MLFSGRFVARLILGACFGLQILVAGAVSAQVIPVYPVTYRPPGVEYRVMRSQHFDVIYQEGTEEQAREMAAVLEQSIPAVSAVFPIRASFRLPVVLNRYSDRGNGFVGTVPFRSEIQGVALFGRSLSPRHADWLNAVGPHELVHAAQGDYLAGVGASWLLRPFAPDLARSINLFLPPGIAEGSAVWVESRLEPGAGRLNHGWFTMWYRAAVGAGRPWSLAQMVERPRYARPGDRFYKGGAELMAALADSTGQLPALTRATAFHNRFPFLGYGVSFWYGTRQFPWSFGRSLRRQAALDEAKRIDSLGEFTESTLIRGRRGEVIRRPRWLSDSSIMAFATADNRRRGLYTVDTRSGKARLMSAQELNEELQYSLGPDSSFVLASRYVTRPLAIGQTDADVFRIDVPTGRATRLTNGSGLLSPVALPDGRWWAIRLSGAFSDWVVGTPDSGFVPVVNVPRVRFLQIEPSPGFDRAAVVVNVMGRQGLYVSDAVNPKLEPVVSFARGSVYDVTWSPDGKWLLFTADPIGIQNIFAYRMESGTIHQLTNVAYGALEPAVSPDGDEMAFVEFADARFELRSMPFAPETAPAVNFEVSVPPREGLALATHNMTESAGRYHSLSYLRPRMVYPTAYYEATSSQSGAKLGVGAGMAIQGSDPLGTWAYWGEGFYQGERLWGEAGLTTAAWVVRPSIRAYRRPDQLLARIGTGATADTTRVIRDERGLEFGLTLPVLLRDNVHRSALNAGVFFNMRENRLLDGTSEVVRDWSPNTTITPVISLGVGLQSNLRDLIPSRGISFVSATEFEFVPDQFGGDATASYNEIDLYLPLLSRFNTGIKLELASLSQTRGFVFDTDFFMPRGHEDRAPLRGTVLRGGVEAVQPFWFPEDGFFLVPSMLHSVYLYGFAERLNATDNRDAHLTSVGGGLGLQMTLLHVLDLDLRFGQAYRSGSTSQKGWTTVFR